MYQGITSIVSVHGLCAPWVENSERKKSPGANLKEMQVEHGHLAKLYREYTSALMLTVIHSCFIQKMDDELFFVVHVDCVVVIDNTVTICHNKNMSFTVPPLHSGGVMLTYKCDNACRHCLYCCSPKCLATPPSRTQRNDGIADCAEVSAQCLSRVTFGSVLGYNVHFSDFSYGDTLWLLLGIRTTRRGSFLFIKTWKATPKTSTFLNRSGRIPSG